MGWTLWLNERRGTDRVLREEYERPGQTILDSAIIGGVWYAALEVEHASGVPLVTAIVAPFRRGPAGRFGYRPMDETLGPVERRCPTRILYLLSPLERLEPAGFAAVWRRECAGAAGLLPRQGRLSR